MTYGIATETTAERQRAALATLSTSGAAMAGVGLGILAAGPLGQLAWPILAGGIGIHLFAMIGLRRIMTAAGYEPARWERLAYWLCWAMILVFGAYILWRMFQ